jgi:anti-anti-sigma factor
MDERNPTTLAIEIQRAGDAATVVVCGEIDLNSSDQLAAALTGLDDVPEVHLDLDGVGYMDSTGLRAVLAARAHREEHGAHLDVSRASTIVARLLEITGLGEMTAGDTS